MIFLYPVEVTDPDDILQMTLYAFMSIEIDAFAFQKFALKSPWIGNKTS